VIRVYQLLVYADDTDLLTEKFIIKKSTEFLLDANEELA
jgi:hypothetical protein